MDGLTLYAVMGAIGLPIVLTALKVPRGALVPFAVLVFAITVALDAVT